MGLTSTFRNAAKKAFKAAGDVVRSVTYTEVALGVYDPAAGTRSVTATNYTVDALLVGLTDREQAWFPADANVQKAIVPYYSLSIEPSSQDYFTIDGARWEIVKILTPPTKAIRVFYIQEP